MSFAYRVKQVVRSIPKGKVSTYKLVAQRAGNPEAARAVGLILNRAFRNREGLPCFRVIKTNGEVGGYAQGEREKIRKLKAEGVEIRGGRVIDLSKYLV